MEVETRSIERPIIGMTIGGFKVTSGVKFGIIPETATEVSNERELRP